MPAEQDIGPQGFAARVARAIQLFEERGMPKPSQRWLAERASSFLDGDQINQTALSKWMAGKSVPETHLRAWALAQALQVDAGWLVFGEGSRAPVPNGVRTQRVAEAPVRKAAPRPAAPVRKRG